MPENDSSFGGSEPNLITPEGAKSGASSVELSHEWPPPEVGDEGMRLVRMSSHVCTCACVQERIRGISVAFESLISDNCTLCLCVNQFSQSPATWHRADMSRA